MDATAQSPSQKAYKLNFFFPPNELSDFSSVLFSAFNQIFGANSVLQFP